MAWHNESSPYDTVEGLRSGCNPPAQAAANRRLPMTGHGSTTQTRSNAQLLPSTTRHVIPHRDKEACSPRHTQRGEEKEKHTYNFTHKKKCDGEILDFLHRFDYNWIPLHLTSSLCSVVTEDNNQLSSLHASNTYYYFKSFFVCAQGEKPWLGAQGQRR